MKIFAERLKELRMEEKISTTQLGKAIGVTATTISRWENCLREPSLANAKEIAKFFKVSTDYLCGLED
ncbi:MAG: helix-turn-helix transcriptional regulator [Candidatus Caccovivens sp.]